jgi:hypothetical protein
MPYIGLIYGYIYGRQMLISIGRLPTLLPSNIEKYSLLLDGTNSNKINIMPTLLLCQQTGLH